jgi:hypothetical protein
VLLYPYHRAARKKLKTKEQTNLETNSETIKNKLDEIKMF